MTSYLNRNAERSFREEPLTFAFVYNNADLAFEQLKLFCSILDMAQI